MLIPFFYGVLARVTDLFTPHVMSAIPFSACEMHYGLIVFYTSLQIPPLIISLILLVDADQSYDDGWSNAT
jgi:hypothetical protein